MSPETRDMVVAEAEGWLNTPYHPHGRLKGIGVDCAMLLAEVYERAGVIPHIEPGEYSPQFGLHRSEEVFQQFVTEYAVEVETPEIGDCVLYKYGRCFSHGGIMVSDTRLVHAVVSVGRVCYGDITDIDLINRERTFYTVRSS